MAKAPQRKITLTYPDTLDIVVDGTPQTIDMKDLITKGLTQAAGWSPAGMPATSPFAKAHPSYDPANDQWKPTRAEFMGISLAKLLLAQAIQGHQNVIVQAAAQGVQETGKELLSALEKDPTLMTVTSQAVAAV